MSFQDISIKSQLRMASLIPMLIVTVSFMLFCIIEFNHNRQEHLAHLSDAYINPLLPAAQWAILHNHQQTLQALIEASTVNPGIQSLAFYDKTGQLLAYGGERPMSHIIPHQESNTHSFSKPYQIHVVAPIRMNAFNLYNRSTQITFPYKVQLKPDITIGWVVITLDTTAIWLTQYKMIVITLFISLISLILGLLIHYFLSKAIYLPINRLRRSMQHIINNAFDIPIASTSRGEIGIIESGCIHLQKKYLNTLEEMSQLIETAISDLQHSHELLEEKNIQLLLDKRKLEEKNKQKSALISNLSHEIRTPLNGIIGFSNLLLESQLNPLEHDYTKTIKSSAQDLLSVITDILDYSKIEACKLQLDSLPLDIRACIDDVFTLIAPKAHKKGLDLIASTTIPVPHTLLGDPLRIKQIITNLIDNAIKFTEKGHILLRTSIEQETDTDCTLCLAVTDTGMGISDEEQSVLFQPFHQADSSISRRYGGSGLGLIICKQLTEQMHGRLTLVSKPNQGSTFSAYLKLEKLNAVDMEKNSNTRFGHLTAMCYDENPLYLEALINGLGSLGVKCLRVQTVSELRKQVTQSGYQLAFINVDSSDPYTLLGLLNQNNIPCIVLSKTFIPNYLSLGAQGFLFKPPNIQKLQDAIIAIMHPAQLTHSIIHPEPLIQTSLNQLRKQLANFHGHLLIADDNLINRRLFYSWLSPHAKITLVEDGDQTVTACNTLRFDSILLDLHMPKLNGLLAAQRIRAESLLNQSTPILLISANSHDFHAMDLKKQGINCCLSKPIDELALLNHLLIVLNKTRTKAIDWSECVRKMSGNVQFAHEYLIQFIEELHHARHELLTFLPRSDWPGLADSAHKLLGACCFFGAPGLQEAVAALEYAAKHASETASLQTTLTACIEQIDLVLSESFHLDTDSLSI